VRRRQKYTGAGGGGCIRGGVGTHLGGKRGFELGEDGEHCAEYRKVKMTSGRIKEFISAELELGVRNEAMENHARWKQQWECVCFKPIT
jgi:hypothetical protein